jgi:hypothetical protein
MFRDQDFRRLADPSQHFKNTLGQRRLKKLFRRPATREWQTYRNIPGAIVNVSTGPRNRMLGSRCQTGMLRRARQSPRAGAKTCISGIVSPQRSPETLRRVRRTHNCFVAKATREWWRRRNIPRCFQKNVSTSRPQGRLAAPAKHDDKRPRRNIPRFSGPIFALFALFVREWRARRNVPSAPGNPQKNVSAPPPLSEMFRRYGGVVGGPEM